MRTILCLIVAVAALTALATTASARSRSSCQTNRTFMQASRAGALPAVYSALHGGAAKISLNCSRPRQ